MKKLILSLVAAATLAMTSFGQAPEGFKYQAVVRDAGNTILSDQTVGMRMTIQLGAIEGTTVYEETFSPTTNAYGLVDLEIGRGTVVSGSFANIDWAAGPYYIETSLDVTGGTNYSVIGNSRLMSVPYALYAKTSGNSTPGPQGPAGQDGADGIDGLDGATGPMGPQGPAGLDGADGIDGLDGATGPMGPQGPAGLDGIAGLDGATGPMGPQGQAGQDGADGIDGLDGATGPIGPQGLAGLDGADGMDGLDGATGPMGPQGPQGPAGLDGADGIDGLDGATGPMGPQGPAGLNGADGIDGAVGPQGPQGIPGVDGADGVGIAQTLSFTSPNLELSNSGGSIDLTALINDADSDVSNEIQNLSQVLTEGNTAGAQLKNVTDPTDAQDATTKAYVDAQFASLDAAITALEAEIADLEARIVALEPPLPAVGDYRDGGIVFWVDPEDNRHGLVCAIENQSAPRIRWDNGTEVTIGVTGTGIGTGSTNTTSIIAIQGAVETSYAAGLARAYSGGDFNDWFLPSKDELNQMYIHREAINTTAIANGGASLGELTYWSSTENSSTVAYIQYFDDGFQSHWVKTRPFNVRAVRAF